MTKLFHIGVIKLKVPFAKTPICQNFMDFANRKLKANFTLPYLKTHGLVTLPEKYVVLPEKYVAGLVTLPEKYVVLPEKIRCRAGNVT